LKVGSHGNFNCFVLACMGDFCHNWTVRYVLGLLSLSFSCTCDTITSHVLWNDHLCAGIFFFLIIIVTEFLIATCTTTCVTNMSGCTVYNDRCAMFGI